ncbi:phage head closure protein [Enterococcus faecium]|uniref:phage head closure protein n=1 Tax=Enterococcus faecium TaxID=1352 RepID=UPI000DA7948D|nr:phage head closure protein [Enterococcus faecium]MDB7104151.1 phage head closure protein [Enterococcus faecium]MDB7251123.1 phage head closure protein [Enterococcus faecium]MDB7260549.1 phage head closure protein [Enterococcus faecium]MDB7277577.1 phage head closure protein [Enterococcus faecium]MDQ8408287.1 phage head closure protein [Enterococcus faecium]
MPLIQTGNLNQRIKFVRDTTVKDEDGQVVPTSTTILTCWASVQTQRLNDIKTSIGTVLEGTLTFIIRYQQKSELTNDMKVKWKGKTFEIITITKGEFAKDFTTVIAKEVQK